MMRLISKDPNEIIQAFYGQQNNSGGMGFADAMKMQEIMRQNQSMMNPSIPAYQNPFNQINPKYTQNQFQHQNQNQNSFAPMQMYQNYKQTGQMPAGDGTVMTGKPTVGGK